MKRGLLRMYPRNGSFNVIDKGFVDIGTYMNEHIDVLPDGEEVLKMTPWSLFINDDYKSIVNNDAFIRLMMK